MHGHGPGGGLPPPPTRPTATHVTLEHGLYTLHDSLITFHVSTIRSEVERELIMIVY